MYNIDFSKNILHYSEWEELWGILVKQVCHVILIMECIVFKFSISVLSWICKNHWKYSSGFHFNKLVSAVIVTKCSTIDSHIFSIHLLDVALLVCNHHGVSWTFTRSQFGGGGNLDPKPIGIFVTYSWVGICNFVIQLGISYNYECILVPESAGRESFIALTSFCRSSLSCSREDHFRTSNYKLSKLILLHTQGNKPASSSLKSVLLWTINCRWSSLVFADCSLRSRGEAVQQLVCVCLRYRVDV